jgi:hypothetical protein
MSNPEGIPNSLIRVVAVRCGNAHDELRGAITAIENHQKSGISTDGIEDDTRLLREFMLKLNELEGMYARVGYKAL